MRLDATVGSVSHDAAQHTLFQVGKAKNGLYATLYKMMVASLDPLGIPVAVDVVPGNRADDPLYVPVYRRIKEIIREQGLLVVGDSKISALAPSCCACLSHPWASHWRLLRIYDENSGRLSLLFKKASPLPELALVDGRRGRRCTS